MAERSEKKKPAPARTEEVVEEAPPATKSGEKIKAELDDLLDEIDEVLERTPRSSSNRTSRRAGSSYVQF